MKDTSLFPPLPRREFLRISATAVAGIAATSLISPTSLFAAGANTPLLSIGYSPSIPDDGQRVSLVSAADILSSDPGFLRSRARVTVAGFSRHPRREKEIGGIQLDAVFSVLSRPADKYPHFNAWSYNGNGDSTSYASPISFTMPVTATDGVAFVLRRVGGAPDNPDAGNESRVQLGVNSDGDAKLARGVYVFALRETGADTPPSWSRFSVSNAGGILTVPSLGISYVVVKIDYADTGDAAAQQTKSKS